jgi:predicted ATPase/Tfp pilus assembly protein PilF
LRIRGEQTYPVLPLAVPGRNADAESLLRSDAVQLFVERARLQKPSFEVTEREAPAVAELCARLEGIPLALELAAARLRALSVQDINKRLHDRFKLLTGGSRVALERQQTLRALVSWSYDLLNEQEQIVLDRLSVFVGGFDLDAAEAVCGAEPIAPEDVLDLVTSLVEKSLIMVKQEEGWSRYGMLETIREFAREHLIELGEEKGRYGLQQTVREFAHEKLIGRDDLAATAARHCEYYHGVAKKARERLHGVDQAEWTRRVEVDLDNLRAATAFALGGGVDPVIAVKIEVALMRFRTLGGYSSEGRNNIRAALALPAMLEPNIARAHALYVGAVLAMNQGDQAEATKMLIESLAIRRALGNQREIAATLSTLSTAYVNQDETAMARESEEEALGIFRLLGDRMGEVIGLINLGEIAGRQGDDAAAQGFFTQGLAIAKSIKHQELEADSERNLGDVALRAGDLRGATTCFERSLKICRDTNDKRGAALALWRWGKADAVNGNYEGARRKMSEALPAFQTFGMNSEAVDCLEDHAQLLITSGRADDAVSLHAAAAAARKALALPTSRGDAGRLKSLAAARDSLGDQAFESAWSAGHAWDLDKAIEHCLSAAALVTVTA